MEANITETRNVYSWRRLTRLSVRSLIVGVLVVGGWMGWLVRSARIQREAVAAIEAAGGDVGYDWDGDPKQRSKPRWPKWLIESVGIDYFANAESVTLGHGSGYPHGEKAVVILSNIGQLRRLKYLNLIGTEVTKEGIGHLKGLTSLQTLYIGRCNVGDAGFESLSGLRELKWLVLDVNRLSDAGIAHLRGLRKLKFLSLSCNAITDAGLEHLKGLSQLETLDLQYNKITDTGVAYLGGLIELKYLYLSYNAITDGGLEHLKGLSKLVTLTLAGNQTTDVGAQQLRHAIPSVRISRFDGRRPQ